MAGRGLAALDDGKVTWLHPSTEPVYASTFRRRQVSPGQGRGFAAIATKGVAMAAALTVDDMQALVRWLAHPNHTVVVAVPIDVLGAQRADARRNSS